MGEGDARILQSHPSSARLVVPKALGGCDCLLGQEVLRAPTALLKSQAESESLPIPGAALCPGLREHLIVPQLLLGLRRRTGGRVRAAGTRPPGQEAPGTRDETRRPACSTSPQAPRPPVYPSGFRPRGGVTVSGPAPEPRPRSPPRPLWERCRVLRDPKVQGLGTRSGRSLGARGRWSRFRLRRPKTRNSGDANG